MPDIEKNTPQVSAQPDQAGQAPQLEPQELGDIDEAEVTFFDPDTIPESVPISGADYVFQVPVNVKSIQPQIEQIAIVCVVYKKHLSYHKAPIRRYIDLENSAYSGTVTVGLNVESIEFKKSANSYNCYLCLKTPDGKLRNPTQGRYRPIEERAHPYKPFNSSTGEKDIPSYALY